MEDKMRRSSGRVVRAWLLTLSVAAVGCASDVRKNPPTEKGGAGGASGSSPDAGLGGSDESGGGGGISASGGISGSTSTGGSDAALPHPELCGNGMHDQGEQCDDGNKKNGDGCDNICRYTCDRDSDCSDGDHCDGLETCQADHTCLAATGPAPDGDICGDSNKCQGGKCLPAAPDCGDGLIERPEEECEDGNNVNGDGCDNCRFSCVSDDKTRDCSNPDPCPGQAACDDNTHTCTPGTPFGDFTICGTGKVCLKAVCTDKYCGNQKIDGSEECDDGNTLSADGCEPTCRYSCVASDTTRDCHSGNACISSGACDSQKHTCSPLLPKSPGTACGTGNNCVQGNCIAPLCGDGIKGPGEACDDGNTVNGTPLNGDACNATCAPTCKAATDCGASPPVCRKFACNAGACSIVADSSQNGNACDAGSGAGTCKDGACTSGACGDGTLATGEQCDDGNTANGDGCDASCRYSCQADSDCDDKDPCNGKESCGAVTGGKKCTATQALNDGTACGGGKICVRSSCRPSFCGDSITDGAKGETCDPPNTVGCDPSCKRLKTCDLSGNWALKVVLKVTWTGGLLVDGSGEADQWALLQIDQGANSTGFDATIRPCGITLPDFHSKVNFGDEWYGLAFPDKVFDSTTIPTFPIKGQVSNLAPGATFTTISAPVLLGLDVHGSTSAVGPWPGSYKDLTDANGYSLPDIDGDNQPGITADVKTGVIPAGGASYKNVIEDIADPYNLDNPGRASKMYIAIRQISAQQGSVVSCDELSGSTTASIDNHVVGCLQDTNVPCRDANLVDGGRPYYTVTSGSFAAARLGTSTSCRTVRAKVP
jgi:cysteine-rich repeat protein